MALRTFCFVAGLLASTAIITEPAAAELRDARVRLTANGAEIWLAFDRQPVAIALSPTDSGAELEVQGVDLASRRIIPRDQAVVQALDIDAERGGGLIRLYGAETWPEVEAELRQGGVLLRIGRTGEAVLATDIPDASMSSHDMTAADMTSASISDGVDPVYGDSAAADSADVSVDPADNGEAGRSASGHSGAGNASEGRAMSETASDGAAEGAGAETAAVPPEPVLSPEEIAARAEAEAQAAAEAARLQACDDAASAVEENPWDDSLQAAHATCLVQAGDVEAASGVYERMLAFEPANVTAAMALAEIRAAQGRSQEARALFDQAASYAISDAEAARARARAAELASELAGQ